MPLSPGVNSYVSLEEAEAYFEERPRRAATWLRATEPERIEALLYATEYLEQRAWLGTPVSRTQALHWPAYYYDSLGNHYADTPVAVKHAAIELALAHLEDSLPAAPEAGPSVSSVAVGPIRVRFGGELKPLERKNPWVERLIAPWITGRSIGKRMVRV